MNRVKELGNVVRETAYAIHVFHGHGHLEKVYENALKYVLSRERTQRTQGLGNVISSIFFVLFAFFGG